MDDLESSLGLRRSSVTPAEAQAKLDKAIIKLDVLQKEQQKQLKVGVVAGGDRGGGSLLWVVCNLEYLIYVGFAVRDAFVTIDPSILEL